MDVIERKTVAIVQLHDDTVNPNLMFQVTIDPNAVSPSEALMRFGAPGDEIIGWKRIDKLNLVEVLGWPNEDGTIEKAPKKTADVAQLSA